MVQYESTGHHGGLIRQVADSMRELIVSGTWPVGFRIPTEPELVVQTGVGRNTIREAVQSLVHAGLLQRRQGSGTFVIATSELPTAITRQFAGARQRDVLEVRQALEMVAATLAAKRRRPGQVKNLQALAKERAEAVAGGDLEQMVQADMKLHLYVAKVAANPVLEGLYAWVLDAVAENIRFNFQLQDTDDQGHEQMVQAIAEGDTALAAERIEHYLQGMIDALPTARGKKMAQRW